MPRNIHVSEVAFKEKHVELVERKGIGHPDTLIDGIMEEISVDLCTEYREEYKGVIQHHNVDKGLICGGETQPKFGGGKFIRPIEIILAGRATDLKDKDIRQFAITTCKDFLSKNVRFLDVNDERELLYDVKFSKGSADLRDVFERAAHGHIPGANDTSFGIGYAPYSPLESTVLNIELFLNRELNKKYPAIGEDIKVMGTREKKRMRITVAMAMVSRHIPSLDAYKEMKERIKEEILRKFPGIELHLNTGDDYARGSVYITETGLSMEMGDDGSVGRGNRANGLITPSRPMTLEATAGKNPVNHVGKIYTVGAFELAKQIAAVDGIENVDVYLLSQVGKPIDQPKTANIEISTGDKEEKSRLVKEAESIADAFLSDISGMTEKIIEKKVGVYY